MTERLRVRDPKRRRADEPKPGPSPDPLQLRRAGNAAFGRLLARRRGARSGRRALQRAKIVNLASGTRPETLMRPRQEGDVVINVDSGHMLMADILRERPTEFFEKKADELGIKREALMTKTQKGAEALRRGIPEQEVEGLGAAGVGVLMHAIEREAYEDNLRQFVIRALFEKHKGKEGIKHLLQNELVKDEQEKFLARIDALQKGAANALFAQGFVEDLPGLLPKGDVDEVHVISALGFDLIRDPAAIESVHSILKEGGRLVITSERTGMAGRAIKEENRKPVMDKNGKPVVKDGIELLKYFTYQPQASAYGPKVFEESYPEMKTEHTAGSEVFDARVSFARLVFVKK